MKDKILIFSAIAFSLILISGGEAMAQTLPSVTLLGAANIETLSHTIVPGVEGTALQSRAGALAAYNAANGLACTNTVSGELGGQVVLVDSSLAVICVNGPVNLNGILTINGPAAGTVVIKIPGDFSIGAGGQVVLGSDPNTIFYQVNGNVTLGDNSILQGTVLATGNITADPGATINGRLLSLNGAVTADPEDINCPSCIATSTFGNITLNKTVINDSGGTATTTDFQFYISGMQINPAIKYAFVPGTYTLSELSNTTNYLASAWGGNCMPNGTLILAPGASALCNITNNDLAAGIINPSTTIPNIPNTGTGTSNLAIIAAILSGTATGFYLISRGIKSLNK